MTSNTLVRSLIAAGTVAFLAVGGTAIAQQKPYEPQVGQAGKDVVWVPSPDGLVAAMLDMAKVTKADNLVDLGSGDGRTVIAAAKRGLKARGIEYNPDMVALSRKNAAAAGVASMATFINGDIFQTDFSDATVVTMFLLPSLNVRLRPTLLKMKPGTRIVSNSFDMGDWTPDQEAGAKGDCTSYCRAMLWIVPAQVDGTWKTGTGQLVLEQKYQMLTGFMTNGGNTVQISEGKMNGENITFRAGGRTYAGKVNGNRILGNGWQASK
jgi:SAM-dependent methyltransferase